MLEIFNDLKLFFEDCHKQYSVREYARIMRISPPTASLKLKRLHELKLLDKEEKFGRIFFWASRDNLFRNLARLYWSEKIKKTEIMEEIEKKCFNPCIILFGSLAKAENTKESDVDLAIIGHLKDFKQEEFEKKIKRKIQIINQESLEKFPLELRNNIINGHVIRGRLKI